MALSGGMGSATPSTIPAVATADDCGDESSVVLEADRRLGVFLIRSSPFITTSDVRRTKKIGKSVIILLLFDCMEKKSC